MSIFHDIARQMDRAGLESLARFREAARHNEPLTAEINELPHGFLEGVGFTDDLRVLYVLTPLGMCVALATKEYPLCDRGSRDEEAVA